MECAALLRRLRAPLERAILDAGMEPQQFDAIVMVGGATRMPMVRSLVARLFGRLPLIHVDPDTTVALGAAIQAALHKRDAALNDVVMTDVCPYTLGVATVEDGGSAHRQTLVTPIIERNAVVPISRSTRLVTIDDNQKRISVDVYQGENLRPEHNVHLGSVVVNVPPGRAGEQAIDVRFTYDINAALQVEVTVASTGHTSSKIFYNSLGLTEDELKAKFAALEAIKLTPREHAANKALIARAERLYAEQMGEARDALRKSADPVRGRDRRPAHPRPRRGPPRVRKASRQVRALSVRILSMDVFFYPWNVLGLSPQATESEIKKAYARLLAAEPPRRKPGRLSGAGSRARCGSGPCQTRRGAETARGSAGR